MDVKDLRCKNNIAARGVAVTTMCFILLYIFDVFAYFGYIIMPVAYAGLISGSILVLTILFLPATKTSQDKVPWYDWVLIGFVIVPAIYIFLFYGKRVVGSMLASPLEIALAIMITIAVLETTRRTIGPFVLFMTLAFPLYALFADYLPGILNGPSSSVARTAGYLFLFHEGMFGTVVVTIGTIVVVYMLFGQLLFSTGAGKFYTDVALALFGKFTGGGAKGSVVASALFGSIASSAMSNVATTGVVTIPLMKSTGFKPEFAGAVETVASTGGLLMPPVMGSLAFIMADYIGIPYASVAIAAAWPSILFYLAVFIQVHFEAKKMGLAALPISNLPSLRRTFATGWYFMIPMLVLICLLMVLRRDAIESAMYAILTILILSFFKKEARLSPKRLIDCFEKTAVALTYVFPICVGAGLLIGSIGLTGLGIRVSQSLIELSGGNIVVLVILAAIMCFIMGLGMAMIPTYIILAVLVAPAMVSMGLNIMAVHLFILYMSVLAIITPPVGGVFFVAAAIARARVMRTGWIACRLGFVGFLAPFVFVFNPAVILVGTLSDIFIWIVLSIIIISVLAVGLEGFLLERMNLLQRAMLVVGGISLLLPAWHLKWAGLGIVAVIIVWHWSHTRSVRRGKSS